MVSYVFHVQVKEKVLVQNYLKPPNSESLFSIFLIITLNSGSGSVLMFSVR